MRRSFTLLFLAISLNSVLLAQWQWQYYSPTGSNLYDVEYLPSGMVIAVGEGGILLQSTDNGTSWKSISPEWAWGNFYGIEFSNSLEGFAFGTIKARTTDGGLSWSFYPIPDSFFRANWKYNLIIYDMKSITANLSWMIVEPAHLLRSTDGGTSWMLSPLPTNATPRHIYFQDVQHGWLYGPGTLLRTTDGGTTWINDADKLFLRQYNGLTFTDSLTGWLSGYYGMLNDYDGYLYKTTDGGATWKLNFQTFYSFGSEDIRFFNNDYGWYLARNGIYQTTDAGTSWHLQHSGRFSRISFLDSLRAVTVGENGQIYHTSNGGADWIAVNPAGIITFQKLFFVNQEIGFASTSNGLMKTTDGGYNFSTILSGNVSSMFFIDGLHGYIGTDETGGWSRIFYTPDGGNTFIDQTGMLPHSTRALWFTDNTHGFAVGNVGHLMKSFMGDTAWTDTMFADGAEFSCVKFITPEIGWIAGSSIYKTTDGGNTWTRQFVDGVQYFQIEGLSVVTEKIVYAVGQNWQIFKTTDGGTKWTASVLPGTGHDNGGWSLNDVWFFDSNTGWVAGNDGLYKTTNGGVTWTTDDQPAKRSINSLYLLNRQHGWAGGNDAFFKNSNLVSTLTNEVTVTTDKSFYYPSDTVHVSIRYWNHSDTTTVLHFGSTCQFNFCIDSVGCWGDGLACALVLTSVIIPPDSFYQWSAAMPHFSTTHHLLPVGQRTVTAWVGELQREGNYGEGTTTFMVLSPSVVTYSLIPNWNLLSFPLDVPDRRTEVVFSTAKSKAFIYSTTYEPVDTIPLHKGFWIRFDSAQSLSFSGSPHIADTIDVQEGWNLVGTLSVPVKISTVTTIPPDLRSSDFFDYRQYFTVPTTLEPGSGYWVRMKVSGKLILK